MINFRKVSGLITALIIFGAIVMAPAANAHFDATVALIGDVPYGTAQNAAFPANIAQINGDPAVDRVIHLGDIKNGSSQCTDVYFDQVRTNFNLFKDPLVYTPGDNEWTDCHRANNGGYTPTERLATLRAKFFDKPGRTLGQNWRWIEYQTKPYVENVTWNAARVQFGVVNVPGSNNDLVPWFAAATPGIAQLDEYQNRLNADLAWIDRVFDRAKLTHSAGVVLGMQADMWDPEAVAANATSGFNQIVAKIAARSSNFGKPVLLLEGDSHKFLVDHPLASGSPLHNVLTAAPNLTRLVVQGSSSTPREYVRLTVDPWTPSVFSWENVPYLTQ